MKAKQTEPKPSESDGGSFGGFLVLAAFVVILIGTVYGIVEQMLR